MGEVNPFKVAPPVHTSRETSKVTPAHNEGLSCRGAASLLTEREVKALMTWRRSDTRR